MHRGWDLNLGREVAIKRVRVSESGEGWERTSELLNEAHTLSALQHPNIVSVYDSGEDDQGSFIVMELVKGETLEQIIERGALNEADFEQLALQALEGLIAAHALNIVHLDLKPLNIMVCWHASGQFQVKLLDFGLARALRDIAGGGPAELAGTPPYMAPEHGRGQPVDHRADLFSLGCVLYEMCAGQAPVQGGTTVGVLMAAAAEPYRLSGCSLAVTFSSGIALAPEDGDDPQALMDCADAAMYRAKRAGRNRVGGRHALGGAGEMAASTPAHRDAGEALPVLIGR